ncbi:hypothetical protein N7493_010255 [Penicillium malachiteum]|uniref:Uncharacterized protein n=1 Tax=Penicillium malachiteum TaxID=1324776 RepID=A0AAD6MRH0_9EURO|nr:hypothetical protein N7493_010255 [Penicillium malachiteum]
MRVPSGNNLKNPAGGSSMSNTNPDMMSAVTNQTVVSTDVEMADIDASNIVNRPAAAPLIPSETHWATFRPLAARNLLAQYGRAQVQPSMNHATVLSNSPNGTIQPMNAIGSTAPNNLAQNTNGQIINPRALNSSGDLAVPRGNFYPSQTNAPNGAATRNSSIPTTNAPSGMGLTANPLTLVAGQHGAASSPAPNLQRNNIQSAVQATNQQLNPSTQHANNNTGGANGINASAFNPGIANSFSGGYPGIQSVQSSLSATNPSAPALVSNNNLNGGIQDSNRNQADRGTPVPAIRFADPANSQTTQNDAYRAELHRVRTEILRNILQNRSPAEAQNELARLHQAVLAQAPRGNGSHGTSHMLPIRNTPPVGNHTQAPRVDHSDPVNVRVHNELAVSRAREAHDHANAMAAARLRSTLLLNQAQAHARTQGQGPGPGQCQTQNSIQGILDSARVGLPVGPNPPGQPTAETMNTPNDFDRAFEEIEEQNRQMVAIGLRDVRPTVTDANRRRAPQLTNDRAALQAYLVRQQLIAGIPPDQVVPIQSRNTRQGTSRRRESRSGNFSMINVSLHNGEMAMTVPHHDPPQFDGDLGPLRRNPRIEFGTSQMGLSLTGSSNRRARPRAGPLSVSSTPNAGSTISQQNGVAPNSGCMNLNSLPSNNNQN